MKNRCQASLRTVQPIAWSGLLMLLAVFLFGCGQDRESPPSRGESPPSVPAQADLVIALLPERNVFEQKVKYLPLQNYLSEKLALNVYFKLLDNYEQIFTEIVEGGVDGGFWGSMNGTIAQVRGGVEMLARPVWKDNSSTYWGFVFTLADSRIDSDPRTWEGHSMAFVNKATTAGFLFPISLMREAGILTDPADFFSKAIFAGSHDAAIIAVLQGEVELGACKNTIFAEFMERNPGLASRFKILASSAEVPSNGLGVRPALDSDLKRRLKDALTSMHLDPEGTKALSEFGAIRFIETSFQDYAPVLDMADAASINLREWPLRALRDARPYR